MTTLFGGDTVEEAMLAQELASAYIEVTLGSVRANITAEARRL